jgi:hypothetical protein
MLENLVLKSDHTYEAKQRLRSAYLAIVTLSQ